MVVIIKKENDKPIYNILNLTEKDREKAKKLDNKLAKIIPMIETLWRNRKIKNKGHKKIDIKMVYKMGTILKEVVDDKNLASPNEKRWIWKAIREMHLKDLSILKTGETRDYLEYFYWTARLPKEFIKKITWPALRQLFHYTTLREDERFWSWLEEKAKKTDGIKIKFMGNFGRNLFARIRNKDTSIYSDKELFDIYESAWEETLKE